MATLISFPNILTSQDAHSLDPQAEVRAVRAQAAVVRSLLDELDMLGSPGGSSGLAGALAAQTVEELTQLAWRMVQTAMAIAPHRVLEMARVHATTTLADDPEPALP